MTGNPNVEIERKFLVSDLPSLAELQAIPVRQGYLTAATDSVEIRLRQTNEAWFLTLKSGSGLRRSEQEIPLEQAQFEALWPATHGRRVEKTRYLGRLEDQRLFELDVFSGDLAPLMIVEVEFDSVDSAMDFLPPVWFGRDVTEDERFKNKALATAGNPLAAR